MNKILDKLKIKIFADGANKEEIIKLNQENYIKGFTTNPSLMKKSGIRDYEAFSKDILKEIKDKPFSLEVFADNFEEIEEQAKKISKWGKNVYVKIPVTNTKKENSFDLIKKLSSEGMQLNITAIFTHEQVKGVISSLHKDSNSIISIFAGRIADAGADPISVIKNAVKLKNNNKKIQLLWASTRQIYSIIEAENCGCDIITVPNSLLSKIEFLGTDLQNFSLETVKQFYQDALESGFKL